MKRISLPLLALACMLLSLSVRGGEVTLFEVQNLPEGAPADEKEFLAKKQAARAKVLEQRDEGYKKLGETVAKLKAEREKLSELKSDTVTIGDQTLPVQEPATAAAALGLKTPVRDMYEVNPEDFSIYEYERWSLNMSDLQVDPHQYITADTAHGKLKSWFGFTFRLTNSTAKPRRVTPVFTAVTNKGVFNTAANGFIPERMMADSEMRPLLPATSLQDKELLNQNVAPLESLANLACYAFDPEKKTDALQPMATFLPGQTRYGAAIWAGFSDEFTELKIVVRGLTNAHRYDEKMERALVLTYERSDDEFNVERVPLKLTGRRWVYIWMWDQSINVPLPEDAAAAQIKSQTLKTPAGADKLMWAFPYVLSNPTRSNQEIAVNRIAFACPVEVDVGGQKVAVEAQVVDDGRSTVYKAQYCREVLQKDCATDRFLFVKPAQPGSETEAQRRRTPLEAGKALDEAWAVFDAADVDWAGVKTQIETALTLKADKKALAKQTWENLVKAVAPAKAEELAKKDPGFLYDPRRRLTDDEMKAVQEQVLKALPAAVEAAQGKKAVVAYFDCTSGLSSGVCRILRSYRKPGVVQEEWLKAWEALDKPGAP
jgi:hypothetical protein